MKCSRLSSLTLLWNTPLCVQVCFLIILHQEAELSPSKLIPNPAPVLMKYEGKYNGFAVTGKLPSRAKGWMFD